MNCLHIDTITNISARVNNYMQIVTAVHRYNTWTSVQTFGNIHYKDHCYTLLNTKPIYKEYSNE